MKRGMGPCLALALIMLVVAGCGGSTNSTTSAPFPPKTKADLHALANSSPETLTVMGRDESSAPPRTAALFVVVPHRLSESQQVAALLKVLYHQHLDKKVGHVLGSAVVLGYRNTREIGSRFTAGRVELDAGKDGRRTMILDANGGSAQQEWKLTY